jgi:hypothetical protein
MIVPTPKKWKRSGAVTKDAHDAGSVFSVSSTVNAAHFEAFHFTEFIPKFTEIVGHMLVAK